MTIEKTIADCQAKGQIRPETADWLRSVYRHELAQHGDEMQARRVLLHLLTRTPEQRKQEADEARAIVSNARLRKLDKSPVPMTLRILQTLVGAILGVGLAMAAVFGLVHGFFFIIEMIFGATPSRVRVPIKGMLAVLVAPIAGAIIGGLYGWKFDARIAKAQIQEFLDSSSIIDRAWIAWGAAWTGVVLVAFSMFDPLGRSRFRYWRDNDWFMLVAIWILPVVGGWAVAQLIRWVTAGRRE